MRRISKLRFDSLAGYSRSPTMPLVAEELDWFEEAGEKVLGVLVRDLPDNDYACYVLGRDAKLRFAAVWIEIFRHPRRSCEALAMATLQNDPWTDNPFPKFKSLPQLHAWIAPLISEENRGNFSGRQCLRPEDFDHREPQKKRGQNGLGSWVAEDHVQRRTHPSILRRISPQGWRPLQSAFGRGF